MYEMLEISVVFLGEEEIIRTSPWGGDENVPGGGNEGWT